MAAPRVLVVSHAPIGRRMAGTAIRAYELSRVLAPYAAVTLASTTTDGAQDAAIPHVALRRDDLSSWRRLIDAADVVVAQPGSAVLAPVLRRSRARLVFDLYTPQPLELLAGQRAERAWSIRGLRRSAGTTLARDRFMTALRDGHHFLCASEQQRAFWLGAMLGEGLITSVQNGTPFESRFAVVPFGVPPEPPQPRSGGLRERFGFGRAEQVVLWNGGLWDWLDPETAIRAAALLVERRRRARLVFMGRSDHSSASEATRRARRLAKGLGLLDRVVFFNDEWVPYDERGTWLLEASCAISASADKLESALAFRTRLVDCLWAGLPIVCTHGDELAEQVAREKLGAVAAAADPPALAHALELVLTSPRAYYAGRLARAAARLAWPDVAEPLVRLVTAEAARSTRPQAVPRPARQLRMWGHRAVRAATRALPA